MNCKECNDRLYIEVETDEGLFIRACPAWGNDYTSDWFADELLELAIKRARQDGYNVDNRGQVRSFNG